MTFAERCDALSGAYTPREIAAGRGPKWLTEALLATSHAKRRLRRWIDMGSPKEFKGLACVGCDHLLDEIIGAVTALPPPVISHVVSNCTIVAMGTRHNGFFSRRIPKPQHPTERAALIVISGHSGDVAATVTHESAHAWLLANIRGRTVERAAVHHANDRSAWTPRAAYKYARDEWMAERLVAEWGARDQLQEYALDLARARFALEKDTRR